jgi:hypothetical protein
MRVEELKENPTEKNMKTVSEIEVRRSDFVKNYGDLLSPRQRNISINSLKAVPESSEAGSKVESGEKLAYGGLMPE